MKNKNQSFDECQSFDVKWLSYLVHNEFYATIIAIATDSEQKNIIIFYNKVPQESFGQHPFLREHISIPVELFSF